MDSMTATVAGFLGSLVLVVLRLRRKPNDFQPNGVWFLPIHLPIQTDEESYPKVITSGFLLHFSIGPFSSVVYWIIHAEILAPFLSSVFRFHEDPLGWSVISAMAFFVAGMSLVALLILKAYNRLGSKRTVEDYRGAFLEGKASGLVDHFIFAVVVVLIAFLC